MYQTNTLTIGTRVNYTGDAANLPGVGVVTATHAAGKYSIESVTVTLKDGRVWPRIPVSLIKDASAPGQRFVLTGEDSAAPSEVSALVAGAEIKKTEKEVKEQEAAASRAARIEALKTDPAYSHLSQGEDSYSGKLAAKNIRVELKKAFPGVKFSVRKAHFGSIDIRFDYSLTDVQAVQEITGKYQRGSFNGMEDIYEDARPEWCAVFGGADYVHTWNDAP